MEDSAIQADSRSLATLLLIRDIQVLSSICLAVSTSLIFLSPQIDIMNNSRTQLEFLTGGEEIHCRLVLWGKNCPNWANYFLIFIHGVLLQRAACLWGFVIFNLQSFMVLQAKRMPMVTQVHRGSFSQGSWIGEMQQASDKSVIISEILDPRTKNLLAMSKISDYVLSNELVSMALAMVAEDRQINNVLEELFAEEVFFSLIDWLFHLFNTSFSK